MAPVETQAADVAEVDAELAQEQAAGVSGAAVMTGAAEAEAASVAAETVGDFEGAESLRRVT